MLANMKNILRETILIHTILCICMLLSACSTMDNGRRWGEDATFTPGWKTVGESACNAVTSPMVFVPAVAAALLQIGNADQRLSDWAVKHTPIAGSSTRAESLSMNLAKVSDGALYVSILTTPGGNDPGSWAASKAKGAAVQGSVIFLDHEIVSLLQKSTGRERPNKSNNESFPSATASGSAIHTALASRNIDAMNIPDRAKTSVNLALHALTFLVAWERVEAEAHYPSDALVGVSLAYFTGYFINDAFMGIDLHLHGTPEVRLNGRDTYVGFCWRF